MDYEPLELIGHGAFGQIRKVRRINDQEVLVRKEISYKSMTAKERAQLIAEFRILKSLNHPNIVKYLHHEHVPELHQVHLYMEFCGGGDLASVISSLRNQETYAPEPYIWQVLVQLLLALYRCHYNMEPPNVWDRSSTAMDQKADSHILHRDIKPENIFLDEENNVKLGDFGLAKLLDQENPLATTYVGTPYYMSPEVLLDKPASVASDIWSLGCVLYELCALHPPFQAKSHLLLSQKIKAGMFKPIPEKYSSVLSRTITACLNQNPLQRPTTATLLTLDIVRVFRAEREVSLQRKDLQLIEQDLQRREQDLDRREKELQRREQDLRREDRRDDPKRTELYAEIESRVYHDVAGRIDRIIDTEVERRMERSERKCVRGPRSIKDALFEVQSA